MVEHLVEIMQNNPYLKLQRNLKLNHKHPEGVGSQFYSILDQMYSCPLNAHSI